MGDYYFFRALLFSAGLAATFAAGLFFEVVVDLAVVDLLIARISNNNNRQLRCEENSIPIFVKRNTQEKIYLALQVSRFRVGGSGWGQANLRE